MIPFTVLCPLLRLASEAKRKPSCDIKFVNVMWTLLWLTWSELWERGRPSPVTLSHLQHCRCSHSQSWSENISTFTKYFSQIWPDTARVCSIDENIFVAGRRKLFMYHPGSCRFIVNLKYFSIKYCSLCWSRDMFGRGLMLIQNQYISAHLGC